MRSQAGRLYVARAVLGVAVVSARALVAREAAGAEPDASAAPNASDAPAPAEVSVRGRARASAVAQSANAVTVVDLAQAKHETSDLGDVVARQTPVTMQRAGGLGSRAAFSLGGLGGERLRFFLDGVPLELEGYVAGIQNVPVNLVERVEVYQGVVPIRFGADALGGAVQLVTDENVRRSRVSASYQLGDFGVHRATASARVFHAETGLFARSAVFYDTADNDYLVDVSAFDAQGRTKPVTVPRFHDGYRAGGVRVGVGLVDKPWADRIVVSAFLSSFDNDVQNGATMARPFGEVVFQRKTSGINARYAYSTNGTRVQVALGYAGLDSSFRDLSNCLYDWYGRCAPRTPASLRGEISGTPSSIELHTDTVFLRTELTQEIAEHHKLRFAFAPTYADRSGRNLLRGPGFDALAQPRRLTTGVVGAELESHFFDDRLETIAFVKAYGLVSRSQSLLATGAWQDMSRDIFRPGGGASSRFFFTRDAYAKASYEYATRQPSTDELFGDGMLVMDSLGLRPETSHNANVGVYVDDRKTPAGRWRGSVLGFSRWSDDMIALLAEGDFLRNVNVWQTRALGVEAAAGWTVPHGDWLSVDGRLVYQDLRNTSSDGAFAQQSGDRIPSIPYLTGTAGARVRARAVVVRNDSFDVGWNLRYVHPFLRGWESLATQGEKLGIPVQVIHGALVTYKLVGEKLALSITLEGQNLTNKRVFDFYGVQRPGRAFFTKWTLDW